MLMPCLGQGLTKEQQAYTLGPLNSLEEIWDKECYSERGWGELKHTQRSSEQGMQKQRDEEQTDRNKAEQGQVDSHGE